MRFFFTQRVACLLAVFVATADLICYDSDLTEVIEVDPGTANALFRGDMPVDEKGDFDLKSLQSGIKIAYNSYKELNRGIPKWPKNYNLLVISNLTEDTPSESQFINTMYTYMGGTAPSVPMKQRIDLSSSEGWYWWQVNPYHDFSPPQSESVTWAELYTLLGSLTASEVDDGLVNQTWNGRMLDFVGLIELLGTLMGTSSRNPWMVYVHSRRGYNRSTAIACAYRMRFYEEEIETAYNNVLLNSGANIFEPQGLKGFLFYYQRYLELYVR